MDTFKTIAKWVVGVGLASAALGLTLGLLWPLVTHTGTGDSFFAKLLAAVGFVGGGIAGLLLGLWKAPRDNAGK